MKIVDISEKYFPTFACCFEEWSEEMVKAQVHRKAWFDHVKKHGMNAKLAIDTDGAVAGMIQYLPAEYSFVEGEGFYVIACIWVYGYQDKGIGDRQKKSMGKALLEAAEADMKQKGAKGIAAWGLALPFWMPSAFFKHFGYTVADSIGVQELVWKPLADEVQPPKWLHTKKKPEKVPGKVTITAFMNGWCTSFITAFNNFQKAAIEFGDEVEFKIIRTLEPEIIAEYGITDAIYIDDEEINLGPPPSYEDTVKMIRERIEKL
ncbi:MAG TPA: GNAT family N-acetyltransferase [Candidatus Cloacimonadota bacterium]|nr:GNAT family N-acetyltransferase [Candidatus Cloacimonadota bacterium]